jgi:penicillin amidase
MPRLTDLPGIAALLGRLVIGHVTTPRRHFTIAQRIDALPLAKAPLSMPINIHWNEHLVPYIQAENERDLAVGLGISHAHLRLGQIEFLKYVSQGRLSELLGPIANDIDHTLRVLDLARVSKATYAGMPEQTKQWMQGYAAGINYVITNMAEDKAMWPEEFQILNVQPSLWTVEDLLTLARLNCADFTWGMWPKLLPLRKRKDWLAVWRHLMRFAGGPPIPAEDQLTKGDTLDWLSGLFGKPGGSNAVAVRAEKTRGGHAMLSGDPHLPMALPSFWILGGLHCPSLQTVGYMLPGLPAVMVGRNQNFAWGGTSMHAASSDLFDVSQHLESTFTQRKEILTTRWGRTKEIILSDSECGPVLTDAPMFNKKKMNVDGSRFAFRWVGHQVSDEITAMLNVGRAQNFQEFQYALKDFAVAGQNMVYADTQGNIAQLMAARLPKRPTPRPNDVVLNSKDQVYWQEMLDTTELPMRYNPSEGFVASANNKPESGSDVLISCFFSPDDRVERLKTMLGSARKIDKTFLAGLMVDVKSDTGIQLRDALLALIDDRKTEVYQCLDEWDGEYRTDSKGALVFEFLLYYFALALHGKTDMAVMTVSWDPRSLLLADIEKVPVAQLKRALKLALAKCDKAMKKYANWGEIHRLRFNHPLAALPIIGKRWRFGEIAAAGANETLMKSAHGFATGKHYVGMSSTARYLFDLGDSDANWFAMLGGQDGCPGSLAFTDLIQSWTKQDMLQIPLDLATVKLSYKYAIRLQP